MWKRRHRGRGQRTQSQTALGWGGPCSLWETLPVSLGSLHSAPAPTQPSPGLWREPAAMPPGDGSPHSCLGRLAPHTPAVASASACWRGQSWPGSSHLDPEARSPWQTCQAGESGREGVWGAVWGATCPESSQEEDPDSGGARAPRQSPGGGEEGLAGALPLLSVVCLVDTGGPVVCTSLHTCPSPGWPPEAFGPGLARGCPARWQPSLRGPLLPHLPCSAPHQGQVRMPLKGKVKGKGLREA